MEFAKPAGPNPLDAERIVARPQDRVDGLLKVSGVARYAYEYHEEAPHAAYGVVRGAGIAKGRIARIDTRAAEAASGVLLVLTHENAPRQTATDSRAPGPNPSPQLQGPEIVHFDQAVALVVAESFEQARAASLLIDIAYTPEDGRFDLAAEMASAVAPDGMMPADTETGDFDAAFAAAPVTLDATYTTPDQAHCMMEPHASTAVWQGGKLTLYTSQQMIHWAQAGVAATLGLEAEDVRIVSAFIGGGFGSKLTLYADAILAAVAARALRRPVKVALSRPQIFNHTSHRPATIQRLRLGATADGRLTAIAHESWSGNLKGGTAEYAAGQTRLLYAGANRLTRHRLSQLDLPLGSAMRAPGEAVGLLALECAMDELAEKLGMDPVELRILNDTQHDPEAGPGRKFSTRQFVECLRTGAETFGWKQRNPRPGQVREGDKLIGLGVAGAIRDNIVQPSGARLRLAGGRLVVETQQTDIGTGSYTVIAQVAAEMMGLPLERIEVRLGDSDFPEAAGSGGSWGANSSTTGVYYACERLREALARKAGINMPDAAFANGRLVAGSRDYDIFALAGAEGIEVEERAEFGDLTEKFAQASFGAHFAEVAVDIHTGEPRIRRMLSVAAAGRIINPKTARSQCLGGMTMGIGAALMEEQVVDKRHGYFVNHDLAEYQVPVHADIPALDVIFLEESDDKSSPIKAKGVGELGICGVGAAVANAIYNAAGVRVRDYPLTMDKILPHLPSAA